MPKNLDSRLATCLGEQVALECIVTFFEERSRSPTVTLADIGAGRATNNEQETKMSKIGVALTALILGFMTKASADQPLAIPCEKVRGMIAGPMVPTPKVAKEIYLAVAHGRGDKVLSANIIEVHDDGDHWTVFQFPSDPSVALRTVGGGTLDMTIGKCNGAIMAHYSR
jgi:hypothetical protein